MFNEYKNEEEAEVENVISPEMRMKLEKIRIEKQLQERIARKEMVVMDVHQELRRAVNNGNFSYRDLVPILKELFDKEEIEVLKMLL